MNRKHYIRCNILGWHVPDEKGVFDGVNFKSVCKYCGKAILQDSQGNWFESSIQSSGTATHNYKKIKG